MSEYIYATDEIELTNGSEWYWFNICKRIKLEQEEDKRVRLWYGQYFVPEQTCQIDHERHCSNCGVFIRDEAVLVRKDLDDGAWTVVPKHINYCPNCGAKVVK